MTWQDRRDRERTTRARASASLTYDRAARNSPSCDASANPMQPPRVDNESVWRKPAFPSQIQDSDCTFWGTRTRTVYIAAKVCCDLVPARAPVRNHLNGRHGEVTLPCCGQLLTTQAIPARQTRPPGPGSFVTMMNRQDRACVPICRRCSGSEGPHCVEPCRTTLES
jgi:hypothetical protein